VREAAETADDIGMQFRPFDTVGIARGLEQSHRALLIGEVFRVLERQIEEAAHVGDGAVEAVKNGAAGNFARQRVGGEGALVTAEHVARKLVEQNEQRQRAFGIPLPCDELAGGGVFVELEKAAVDFLIERRIFLEPAFRPDRAPEGDDFGGIRLITARHRKLVHINVLDWITLPRA
jgi:hypothetical protein